MTISKKNCIIISAYFIETKCAFQFSTPSRLFNKFLKLVKSMNFQNRTTFIFRQTAARITVLFLLFLFTAVRVFTQTQTRMPPAPQQPTEDYMWWYLLLFALLLALAGAVVWMLKTRKAEKEPATRISKKEKLMSDDNAWDDNSIDANRGLEWFRRHKKSIGKSIGKSGKRNLAESLPKTGQIFNLNDSSDDLSSEEFKEKLENLQVTQFPVFRFEKLELARPVSPLTNSNDDALMSAIEQTHDEFEEDEEVRDLAVRILARFKTRTSIEALSQVALYDLSSNLRSKAIAILTEFDH